MKRYYVEILPKGTIRAIEVRQGAQPHEAKPIPLAHIYLNAQDEAQAKTLAMGKLHLDVRPRDVPDRLVGLILEWCGL